MQATTVFWTEAVKELIVSMSICDCKYYY